MAGNGRWTMVSTTSKSDVLLTHSSNPHSVHNYVIPLTPFLITWLWLVGLCHFNINMSFFVANCWNDLCCLSDWCSGKENWRGQNGKRSIYFRVYPCSAKVQILHKRDVGQFAVNHETEGDVHWGNGASEVVSTSVQVCSIDYFTRMPKFIQFFLGRWGSKTWF